MTRREVILELECGEQYKGELIGCPQISSGELVFSTGMVGYSEAISDPSYFGQILVFSYPLIGNYGIPHPTNDSTCEWNLGHESDSIHAAAVIIGVDSLEAFHWQSQNSLDQWLQQAGVPGIVGLDTRMLVRRIRERHSRLARVIPQQISCPTKDFGITTGQPTPKFFDPSLHELSTRVSTPERQVYGKGKKRVAIYDFGVKRNIIRECVRHGCEVELLPADTIPQNVDASGWLLSNGPGNPQQCRQGLQHTTALLQQDRPLLGICLGHQLLAISAGFETRRMQYGHRSHNQPIEDLRTGRAYITSQNHGYEVYAETPPEGWEVWFRNLNDQSIEGIYHRSKPFRSVQFHPESAGGPRDTHWVLQQFIESL
ncbi:MAG: glutamine-hydrolyzing carbamoyl-phosphate synthase small subunit [Zetaproteobacteria bacterium]|nr:glutamine-hydrolyzing carbamoyl-phosphate synthase small subunit [Zetaproteobacteria bacterium]